MPFPALFGENTADGINRKMVERSLESANLGTARIDPHVEHSVQGEVEAADTQLLPILLSSLPAVNLKVRFDVLDHELHVHRRLAEGLRRPVRVALVGHDRSQIERFRVLALHRALDPVVLREIHNQSGLVELVLRRIAHVRLQNEIAAAVRP